MAQEKKQPRLITYGDNQYSFDAVRKAVLDNYTKYASKFGYNKNKFMKDYLGLTELLRLIENDENVTFETGRINFGGNYANERGAFGKARNASKHYMHPAWMILDTIQGMTPYEEAQPQKEKISKALIQDAIKNELPTGWETLSDKNKRIAIGRALDVVNHKYKWEYPDLYELEEGRDMGYYRNILSNAATALGTPDTEDDELDIYAMLGLTPSEKVAKATESGTPIPDVAKNFIEKARSIGYTEEEAISVWNKEIRELKLKELLNLELNPSTTSDTSNTTNQSGTAGTAGAAGVVATNNNPPAAPANPPSTPPVKKPSKQSGKKTVKKAKVTNRSSGNKSVVGKVIHKLFGRNGAKLNYIRKLSGGDVIEDPTLTDYAKNTGDILLGASIPVQIGGIFNSKAKIAGRLLANSGYWTGAGANGIDAIGHMFNGNWNDAAQSAIRSTADVISAITGRKRWGYNAEEKVKRDAARKTFTEAERAKENSESILNEYKTKVGGRRAEAIKKMREQLLKNISDNESKYTEAVKLKEADRSKEQIQLIKNYDSWKKKLSTIDKYGTDDAITKSISNKTNTIKQKIENDFTTAKNNLEETLKKLDESQYLLPLNWKQLSTIGGSLLAGYGLTMDPNNPNNVADLSLRIGALLPNARFKSVNGLFKPPSVAGIIPLAFINNKANAQDFIPGSLESQLAYKENIEKENNNMIGPKAGGFYLKPGLTVNEEGTQNPIQILRYETLHNPTTRDTLSGERINWEGNIMVPIGKDVLGNEFPMYSANHWLPEVEIKGHRHYPAENMDKVMLGTLGGGVAIAGLPAFTQYALPGIARQAAIEAGIHNPAANWWRMALLGLGGGGAAATSE